MLAYIDYALIVVFFVVLFGLVLWIASPRKEAAASTSTQAQALPPPRENKLAYGFLAALLVLLFVLTILDQRQHAHTGS
jgi:ABC-type Fe3+ transport system permease subunit